MKQFVIIIGLAVSFLPKLNAGTTFQEQAARLQNINAYLLDFRPGTAPDKVMRHRLELALDFTPQPSVDTRVGNKDEPVDPPSVVPKVRARYLTRIGVFLGGTYVPGLEFEDYEADYYSLEAGIRRKISLWHWAARIHITDGEVTGPITEIGVKDLFTLDNQGLDFSLGRMFGPIHVYGFAGYTETDTSLEIESDGVQLENTDDTIYGGIGGTWRIGRKAAISLEQNFTDDYLKHLVLSLSYRF